MSCDGVAIGARVFPTPLAFHASRFRLEQSSGDVVRYLTGSEVFGQLLRMAVDRPRGDDGARDVCTQVVLRLVQAHPQALLHSAPQVHLQVPAHRSHPLPPTETAEADPTSRR